MSEPLTPDERAELRRGMALFIVAEADLQRQEENKRFDEWAVKHYAIIDKASDEEIKEIKREVNIGIEKAEEERRPNVVECLPDPATLIKALSKNR